MAGQGKLTYVQKSTKKGTFRQSAATDGDSLFRPLEERLLWGGPVDPIHPPFDQKIGPTTKLRG